MAKVKTATKAITPVDAGEYEYTGTYKGVPPSKWELSRPSGEMFVLLPCELMEIAKEHAIPLKVKAAAALLAEWDAEIWAAADAAAQALVRTKLAQMNRAQDGLRNLELSNPSGPIQ